MDALTPPPRRRGRRLLALALTAAMALALLPAAPTAAWSADGPITVMTTSTQLSCVRVGHEDTDAVDGLSGSSRVDDCGTMLAIEGGNLYAADRLSPGGPHDDVRTWRSISGDAFGDGSPADPVRSVTRVGGSQSEDPDLEVVETNAYVNGDDAYLNTVEIRNGGVTPLRGILYRRADCAKIVHDPATGGVIHTYATMVNQAGPGGSIACVADDPELPGGAQAPRVVMTPHTPGASHLGDDFGDDNLFEALEGGRQVYGNTCVCDEPLDAIPRIGLAWVVDVPPGGSATFQHSFAFSPLGGTIDPVSSLVQDGGGGPGPGGDAVTRLQGPSRFETAVAISQELFADGQASAVALARADNFADALAGAPFANAQRAPLLLTSTDSLHPATRAEIQRVLPAGRTVHVLGGTVAVSDAVVAEIQALGYTVERIAGDTRYATSVAIARRTTSVIAEIFYADGNTFGNALAAGAAAAGRAGAVLLLLNGTTPTREIEDLVAELDARPTEYVLGAITEDSPDIAVQPSRTYDEGSPVANAAALAGDPLVFDPSATAAVAVASSEAFPDGLAGGVHAGRLGIPLLLTPQASLAPEAAAAMGALSPLVDAYLYGGDAALSGAVAEAVAGHLS